MRRRRSADERRIKDEVRKFDKGKAEDRDLKKNTNVEPLIDPFTGVKLFHIASHNLQDASVLTRNVEAGYSWFVHVQRAIYKSYAALASSIQ